MRMRVDEPGRHAATLCVEHCLGQTLEFDFSVGPCCGDAPVFDEQRSVTNDAEFAEFRADTRARRTAERNKLTDVNNGEGADHGHFHPWEFAGTSVKQLVHLFYFTAFDGFFGDKKSRRLIRVIANDNLLVDQISGQGVCAVAMCRQCNGARVVLAANYIRKRKQGIGPV